jgi:hypothetical protein
VGQETVARCILLRPSALCATGRVQLLFGSLSIYLMRRNLGHLFSRLH